MLQEGNEWCCNVYCLLNPQCGYKHYSAEGAITVGGQTGRNVSSFTLQEMGIEETRTDILRQSNDTIYCYSEEAGVWHLLYDFGAQPGDIWEIQTELHVGYDEPGEPEIFKVLVDAINQVTIGENMHRVIYTSACSDNIELSSYHFGHNGGRIIDGIGPVDMAHGLTGQSINELLLLRNPSFACFIADGALIWGSSASPCYTLNTANAHSDRAELNLYPNPVVDLF